MLAGPIPRNTNRFNIGSPDQLIGVGVGLGTGPVRAGDGVWTAAGVCDGFSARTAIAPSVTTKRASAQTAASRPPTSRAERHVSLIGEIPFKLWLKTTGQQKLPKKTLTKPMTRDFESRLQRSIQIEVAHLTDRLLRVK